MKYQLYIVTHLGFYQALVGSPPSENRETFMRLAECIEELRPGHGVYYVTRLVETDELGFLGEKGIELLQEVQRTLP